MAVGCSAKSVQRLLAHVGGLKPRANLAAAWRLSLSAREEISRGLLAGESFRAIARRLERAPSTVSREVVAGGARAHYRAWRSEARARRRARRPKPPKLLACPRLRAEVERGLERRWPPQQIAARICRDFPDDVEMRVSHETIYPSLFVQRWGALRRELIRCLRTGHAQRRPQHRASGFGRLKHMVMTSERPAEIEDRAVSGHWEGDLIMGKPQNSAIATLVERQTRFVLLDNLQRWRLAEDVKEALIPVVQDLPVHLRRSLSWDQGREMAEHQPFTIATGVQVYFCDPHRPWQRATNEDANGLLRQYFPRGTDLSTYTQGDLNVVAAELNRRPRHTLDWQTPSEAFAHLVAVTT